MKAPNKNNLIIKKKKKHHKIKIDLIKNTINSAQ